ncbi:hypothetical protein HDU76_002987 [Blyttiomyces sp. JEL0837]|nr:hypothetical protein HDU76_002987 [Blyttiomyces sp. JEL0837]
MDSGGHSLKAAIDVSQSGVVAVIGDYFSRESIYYLEAFSNFKQAIELVNGFVMYNLQFNALDSPEQLKFSTTRDRLIASDLRFASLYALGPDELLTINMYDCTKAVLYGLHKVGVFTDVEIHNAYSPEMLANGSLTDQLQLSVFRSTGYRGTVTSPLTFDMYGDLQVNTLVPSVKLFVDIPLEISRNQVNLTSVYLDLYVWIYAIFYMSRYGKMKKKYSKYVKDGFLLLILSAFFAVALILLIIWQTSYAHDALRVTPDRMRRLHLCSATSIQGNHASADNIASAMIAYIGFLISATGLLSYLTHHVHDTISEASFLSFSAMTGVIAFAVTLATIFGVEPSLTSTFIRNVVIWFIANTSLLALYVPKLMEAFAELHEQQDEFENMGALPDQANFVDDPGISSRSLQETDMVKNSPAIIPSVVESHKVAHLNLRGAYLKIRTATKFWSGWEFCGVTLCQGLGKKWIVIESDIISSSWRLNETTKILQQNGFIQLQLLDDDQKRRTNYVWIEFDDAERMKIFLDQIKAFQIFECYCPEQNNTNQN